MITFELNGVRPEPKGRPRAANRGEFATIYSPVTKYEKQLNVLLPLIDDQPIAGAVDVFIEFHFARPKSHYGTGRNAQTVKDRYLTAQMTQRPDLDNLDKAVLDCLVKAELIEDDSMVVALASSKHWAQGDQTRIVILEHSLDRLPPLSELLSTRSQTCSESTRPRVA